MTKEDLKQLIAKNKASDVIRELKVLVFDQTNLYNQVLTLEARYNGMLENRLIGIEHSSEEIKINISLLRMIDFAFEKQSVEEDAQQHEEPSIPIAKLPTFQAGGALRENHPSYIERREDVELGSILQGHNGLAVIWGPRQMGKSSMVKRALSEMKEMGYRTAYVDLTGTGRLAYSIEYSIMHQLFGKVDENKLEKWNKRGLTFFLSNIDVPAVIAFDEVGFLDEGVERNDFFYAIRAFRHSQSISESRVFILISSFIRPSEFIQSLGASPFNVGRHIRVQVFNRDQVNLLLKKSNQPINPLELEEAFQITGGQPYLVQQLGILMESSGSIANALRFLKNDSEVTYVHISAMEKLLHSISEDSNEIMLRFISGKKLSIAEENLLEKIGIVRRSSIDGHLDFVNDIYKAYFKAAIKDYSDFRKKGFIQRLWLKFFRT